MLLLELRIRNKVEGDWFLSVAEERREKHEMWCEDFASESSIAAIVIILAVRGQTSARSLFRFVTMRSWF
jgi:hypothetical protein